jgi:hypothetical protein
LTARTKLRIIVPLLQVAILVLVCSLDPLLSRRYAERTDLRNAYVVTPLRVVLKLNFPLAIFWLPILYLTAPASSATGSAAAVLTAVVDLAVLMSTAAFWYFVVIEVEMRKRKGSYLRLSGRLVERLKATMMILVGVGAAVFALWDGHRLVLLDQVNRHGLFWSSVVADALIGGLFLSAWAAAFITIGIQDMVRASASG